MVGAAVLLAVAVAFTPAVVGGPQATAAGVGDCNADATWPANRKDYADQVIALVNQHRASLGLVQLKVSPTLTGSAVWKARHMAKYLYMQHDDPAPPIARTWFQRVQACAYAGYGAGENIAYGYGTPAAVMQGWLNSSGHRASIENSSYRVIGVGAAGSNTIFWAQNFGTTDDSGTPPPSGDTTPPTAPPSLTSSATSSTQVSLSWGASTDNVGVTGYRVYRGGVQIATTASRSYVDSVAASTTYSYTVKAHDAAGNLSASSNTASVTTPAPPPPPPPPSGDTTPPSVPPSLTGSATSSTQVSLSWGASTDNVGVTGYRVYRNGVQVASTTLRSYIDSGLAAGTTYSYTVKAYDAAGNLSASSNTASVTTFGTPPPPATTIAPYDVVQAAGLWRAGTAASLKAVDGSTYDVAGSSYTRTAAWYGKLLATNGLTSLAVTYTGASTQSCTQTISIYNWNTFAWTAIDTRSAGSTQATITVPVSGSLDQFVSNSTGAGEVRVKVSCTRGDTLAFIIRGDLLSITYR